VDLIVTIPRANGTAYIGVKPATNLLHGLRYASEQRGPLSLAVTLNWNRLDVPDADALALFRQVRQKVRRRWTYLQKTRHHALAPLDDAGAHENPDGKRNTHWLVRVSQDHEPEFKAAVARALKVVLGRGNFGKGLHFRRVETIGSFAKYVLKGIEPVYADYFHIRAVDQGFIEGRGRTFVSRAIGYSARKQAGWVRKRRPPA
jgi:hypothetical protein